MRPLPMSTETTTEWCVARRLFAFSCLWLLLCAPAAVGATVAVSVTGLEGELLQNVEASLRIRARQQDSQLDAETITALHNEATWEIRRALEPFGYYRPRIDATLTPPGNDNAAWQAAYAVTPGEPVAIAEVSAALRGPGETDTALQRATNDIPLRPGDTLDHRDYEAAKVRLLEQAQTLGFLDAAFSEHRVEVDMASYAASVQLLLDTGPRYHFGPISFSQQQFATDYLEHYLVITEGDVYNPDAIARQRAALSRSGHFREVNIVTGEPLGDTQPAIPIGIELTPFKPNRYRGRLGWGTDYGLGGQLDWTRRYLGRKGHQLTLGATAVEDRNRIAGDASYTIPIAPLSGSSIEFTARHESKDLTFDDVDLDEGGETRIATNIASMYWHMPRLSWHDFTFDRSIGLGVAAETYDIFEVVFGNLSDSSQQDIIESIGRETYDILAPDFETVVPTLRLELYRADDPLYIRRGDFYKLALLGASEDLGSSISFWQLRADTWNIFPVGENNRLLLRSSLGYSDAESETALGINFNQLPEYFEFRAGGARSVRGYGFEELFADDTITGGKHLLVASVEYEQQIIPDFSAAVFLDAGNAFNDFDDIGEKLGAGFGLRWRSPVGLARIDFGFPLDDAEDSFQIYITVGPEF